MSANRIRIAHAIGRSEARARLEAHIGLARGASDLKGTWEGDAFAFSFSFQGMALSGRAEVEEDGVAVEYEAPGHAAKFAGEILTRLIQKLLEPLPAAPMAAPPPAARPVPAAESAAGPTVLFLHIPKAGGTTLADYVYGQCRNGPHEEGIFSGGVLLVQYGFFKEDGLRVPEFVLPFLGRPDLRAVVGHFWHGVHEHLARPWTYITVLRDPVERVVSLYDYLKLQDRMSLEEFAASPPFREADNDQTRRIAGVDPPVGGCTAGTLRLARENLRSDFAVVGTLERLEETVVLLDRRLGWKRQIALQTRNVNPERQSVASLPPSVVDAIRARNELDVELHRFAGELLDEAVAAEGAAFHHDLARRRQMAAFL